jgi:hypothetical protein
MNFFLCFVKLLSFDSVAFVKFLASTLKFSNVFAASVLVLMYLKTNLNFGAKISDRDVVFKYEDRQNLFIKGLFSELVLIRFLQGEICSIPICLFPTFVGLTPF